MEDNYIAVTELIHQVRFGLRVDRLGSWSKNLEGIQLLDLHILKLVEQSPEIILKEIRQELNMPHSTLTSAINRLGERGLIERVISQRDLRSFGLILTQNGRNIRKEHDRVDRLIATKVLEALDTEEERGMLSSLLEKVNKVLSEDKLIVASELD